VDVTSGNRCGTNLSENQLLSERIRKSIQEKLATRN